MWSMLVALRVNSAELVKTTFLVFLQKKVTRYEAIMSQNIKSRPTRNPLKRGGKKEALGIKILEFFFLLIKQNAEGIQICPEFN